MKTLLTFIFGWFFFAVSLNPAAAEDEKYTLRYRFLPGETIRWQVEQQSRVRTTVAGSTQTADTVSISMKAWKVKSVQPDGTATFVHQVDWIDMRQQLSDSEEMHYDSRTDPKPPLGFNDAAASVGVPLATVTMTDRGTILKRERRETKSQSAPYEGPMTIPLPDEPVAVGHVWTLPNDIDVPLETGGVKKIKAVQQFKLESVKTGVASISVSTIILQPVTDPAIEAKLVQSEAAGVVRFDIDEGRIIGQQMDVDKHVVGFRGATSSLHYVTRFSEQWVPETAMKEKR